MASKKGKAIRLTEAQVAAHNANLRTIKGATAALQADASKSLFTEPTAKQRLQALGRLPAGTMNKTEAAYDAELKRQELMGYVQWRKFEGIKLRLADNTFYTPDFAVMASGGVMELHEVKGFWTDDARVKIKVAAALFPFVFVAVQKLPAKDGGGWKREYF